MRNDTCKMCWRLMISFVRLASYSSERGDGISNIQDDQRKLEVILLHAGAGLAVDPAIASVFLTKDEI